MPSADSHAPIAPPVLGPGVSFTPPPIELRPSIQAAIDRAVAVLKDDPSKSVALVSITNGYGTNAALVARSSHWQADVWIGKSWRAKDLDYGASVTASW